LTADWTGAVCTRCAGQIHASHEGGIVARADAPTRVTVDVGDGTRIANGVTSAETSDQHIDIKKVIEESTTVKTIQDLEREGRRGYPHLPRRGSHAECRRRSRG